MDTRARATLLLLLFLMSYTCLLPFLLSGEQRVRAVFPTAAALSSAARPCSRAPREQRQHAGAVHRVPGHGLPAEQPGRHCRVWRARDHHAHQHGHAACGAQPKGQQPGGGCRPFLGTMLEIDPRIDLWNQTTGGFQGGHWQQLSGGRPVGRWVVG